MKTQMILLLAVLGASAWPDAAAALNAIRRMVATNLLLALCIVAAALFSR